MQAGHSARPSLDRARLAAKKSFTFSTGVPPLAMWLFGIPMALGAVRGAFLGTPAAFAQLAAASLLVLVALPVLGRALRVRVGVGTDGLSIRNAKGDRFVSFAEIERISPMIVGDYRYTVGIRFKARGGQEQQWSALLGTEAFLETVGQAIREYQRRGEERKQEAPIGPRALPSTKADYRQAAYPTDVLIRIAENPAEHVDARLAATRALRERPDLTEHARIRVAAEETASEALRTELEELAAAEPGRRATRG